MGCDVQFEKVYEVPFATAAGGSPVEGQGIANDAASPPIECNVPHSRIETAAASIRRLNLVQLRDLLQYFTPSTLLKNWAHVHRVTAIDRCVD